MTDLIEPQKSNFKYLVLSLLIAIALGVAIGKKFYSVKPPFNPVPYIMKRQSSAEPLRQVKKILAPEVPARADVYEVKQPEAPTKVVKKKLTFQQKELDSLSPDELRQNIVLADKVILEDADRYDAYKTKLFSLLALELKHKVSVDIEEYERLYDELLQFEWTEGEDGGPRELVGIDESLIHIPFLRLSALGELNELGQLSEDYIEQFPGSYIGYAYLAEAHMRNGDEDLAQEVLIEAAKQTSNEEVAKSLLNTIVRDPLKRLMGL